MQIIISKLLIDSEKDKNEYSILSKKWKILTEENEQCLNEIKCQRIELSNMDKQRIRMCRDTVKIAQKCEIFRSDFRNAKKLVKQRFDTFLSFLTKAQYQISKKMKGKLILFEGDIIGNSTNKTEILTKFKWKLLDKETEIKTLEAKQSTKPWN